ncbi:MAG: hypothetical protein ACU837_17485 [Gammaproteobacteria bacterium]
MHINKPSHRSQTITADGIKLLLREAKKLHRAATSDSLVQALPVLRRLITSDTLKGVSLPELHRRRHIVQRKHILRMLAVEAGYTRWEEYRRAMANASVAEVGHFDIVHRKAGYPNIWFSSLAEAQAFAAKYGGYPLRVGKQAVVFAEVQDDFTNLDIGRQ